MENNRPNVLVIAGVDSGGGAGITADCISIHDNGGRALPCVSALTCQSLKRVGSVESAGDSIVKESLELSLSDWESVGSAKVGLIVDAAVLKTVIEFFKTKGRDIKVVWDPVLCATAGRLESADLKAFLPEILKICTIFTPNLPEALELAGWSQSKFESLGAAALGMEFVKAGAKSCIIKGGHLSAAREASDVFVSDDLQFVMQTSKVEGDGAHGGGCGLSSALAAYLALGYAPFDAAVLAKAYVYRGIKEPDCEGNQGRPPLGHHGFPNRLEDLPLVFEDGFPKQSGPFPPCPKRLGLYPVVDSPEWIERLLKLGVRTLQLRIKDRNDPRLYDKIVKAVSLGREYRARVFIDDYYELAIKAGAYGVHLGMEDLRCADLEKIRQAGLRLGVSTHGAYEMLKALQLKPSYIALGHIFPTQSKAMPSKPQGIFKLAAEQRLLSGVVPTVAIGGIKLFNAKEVLNTQVGSIALITGITKATDPHLAVKEWLELCGSGGNEE